MAIWKFGNWIFIPGIWPQLYLTTKNSKNTKFILEFWSLSSDKHSSPLNCPLTIVNSFSVPSKDPQDNRSVPPEFPVTFYSLYHRYLFLFHPCRYRSIHHSHFLKNRQHYYPVPPALRNILCLLLRGEFSFTMFVHVSTY